MKNALTVIASSLTEGMDSAKKAAGSGNAGKGDIDSAVQTGIQVLIWIVGIAAVIVIIIGGIMYTTSAGDASKTKRAKDTIFYGIIGLIIALLAYTIVLFVGGQFDFN